VDAAWQAVQGGPAPSGETPIAGWSIEDVADAPALRAAYVPSTLARPAAGRWVALGDSITAADAYLRFAVALAGGRLRAVHNAGVGGDQINQMLARFDTDVTPYAPTMVSLMGGTNDYTFGCTDADFRARVQSFVTKTRSIGAVPLLFTSPPCNVLADPDRAKIPRNNAWMADYASREGITLIDAYSVLVDPAQSYGKYLSSLVNVDGIHPNDDGHYAVAQLLVNAINTLLPAKQPFAVTTADPTNLLTNGLMKDTNADGQAESWGQNWGPDAGTWTFSIVNDAAVPGGTMQRTGLNAATGKVQLYQDVSSGFVAGDVLRFSGLITVGTGMSGAITLSSSGTALGSRTFARPFTRGLIDYTFTVPTPAPAALRVELATTALAAGTTGTVDYGALTLRNLTALGVA